MKTYKILDIFNEMKKYHKMDFKISGENKEFNFELRNEYIPHLLGLQYLNEIGSRYPYKGIRLYKYVKENKFSDEEILSKIENNHGLRIKENVKARIDSFMYFMNNLEKGVIVEKTYDKTKISVNYLIVESKDNEFYHLGIQSNDFTNMIDSYGKLEERDKLSNRSDLEIMIDEILN